MTTFCNRHLFQWTNTYSPGIIVIPILFRFTMQNKSISLDVMKVSKRKTQKKAKRSDM